MNRIVKLVTSRAMLTKSLKLLIITTALLVCIALFVTELYSSANNTQPMYYYLANLGPGDMLPSVASVQTTYNNNNNNNKNDDKQSSTIKLTGLKGLYLDPQRSAVFYANDNMLVFTFLIPTVWIDKLKQVSVRVRRDGQIVLESEINVMARVPMGSRDYKFSMFQISDPQKLCSSSSSSSSSCKNPITSTTKLTFQLTVSGTRFAQMPVNVIDPTRNTDSQLTARLIKCMWMPEDARTFRYIMQLIVESRYDAIYVCVFREDRALKQLLAEFEPRQRINVIELESVPHVVAGGRELRSREQIERDESIEDKGWFLDPALEFLLNQVYPFLIERYKYVQVADYDHILFTKNMTFAQRMHALVAQFGLSPRASLYFNQWWALDNQVALSMFQHVDDYLAKYSLNASVVSSLPDNDRFFEETSKVALIHVPEYEFELRIAGRDEWMHAVKTLEYLRDYMSRQPNDAITTNTSNSSSSGGVVEPMLRQIVFKFQHMHIYGQTVHNTKSSMVVKLCEPDALFANGQRTNVADVHLLHYRDSYRFELLKTDGSYIPVTQFITFPEFDEQN